MGIPKSKNGEMPFLDHLEELRWRIIYALAAVLIGVAVGFVIAMRIDLVGLLATPVLPLLPEHKLVYTHPTQGFTVVLNSALVFGLVVASPIVIYQIWAFLSPALHPHERRVGLAVLVSGVFLFAGGAALAFFVVVPISLPWLFGFSGPSLVPLITAEDYFGYLFTMILTFGLSFELPIVILALSTLGIVTPSFLRKYRRHTIVLIVAASAVLTPGDAVSTAIALSLPLYALFELSVLVATVVDKKRQRSAELRLSELSQ